MSALLFFSAFPNNKQFLGEVIIFFTNYETKCSYLSIEMKRGFLTSAWLIAIRGKKIAAMMVDL